MTKTCTECSAPVKGKYSGSCRKCGADTCPKHTHFYVDESNVSITRGSPPQCVVCAFPPLLGILDRKNLLSSGDYIHRDVARARFHVVMTVDGSRVA